VCHPEYPAYAEYSLICLQALACPRAFFLLFASVFLLSFAKEGRKMRILNKKNN